MFCEKCGKQLNDGETICPECAAKESANAQEANQPTANDSQTVNASQDEFVNTNANNPQDAPAAEPQGNVCPSCGTVNGNQLNFCSVCGTALNQATYSQGVNQSNYSTPVTPQSETSKKKMNKKTKIILISAISVVVVALVILAIVFFLKPAKEDPTTTALNASKNAMARDIAGAVGKAKDMLTDGFSSTGEIEITFGEQFAPMVKKLSGTDIPAELSWIKSASISVGAAMKGSEYQVKESISLNGTNLLDCDIVFDYATGNAYIGYPTYQPQYLHIDFSDMPGMDMEEMQEVYNTLQTLLAALPDEAEVEAFLSRYVGCIISAAGERTQSKVTLTAEGVSQEVNALTLEIGYDDLVNIAKAVVSELKNDNTIKNYINNISSITNASVENYERDISMLEQALSNTPAMPEGTLATVTFYADGSEKLAGWDITVEGYTVSYYTVTNGDQVGVLFKMPIPSNMGTTNLEFAGKGIKTDDKITGTYAIKYMSMDVVTFEAENFQEDGKSGTVTVRLSETVTSMLPAQAKIASDFALKYTWETVSETEENAEISLLYQDGMALSLKAHAVINDFTEVEKPTDSILINPESTDATEMQAWLEGFDMEKLFANLRSANVPGELVDELETSYERAMLPPALTYTEWIDAIPADYYDSLGDYDLYELYEGYVDQYYEADGELSVEEYLETMPAVEVEAEYDYYY
ncbi:MAG: hypothetical protein IKW04_00715 [Clostridia bacterium]|nr:hypothetical protein [Clostridia bacterium]